MPEDAAEYVRLYAGTLDGARFVCAIDYLTNVTKRVFTHDLIVRAYLIAIGHPDAPASAKYAFEAQSLLDDDAVQVLLDRVRYHTERRMAERLARRAGRKIEELFDRSEDAGIDLKDKLQIERLAVGAALSFHRQVGAAEARKDAVRAKRAVVDAQNRAPDANPSGEHALPSPGEAKQFLAMLRERYGPDTFSEIIASIVPPALPIETVATPKAAEETETTVDVGE